MLEVSSNTLVRESAETHVILKLENSRFLLGNMAVCSRLFTGCHFDFVEKV